MTAKKLFLFSLMLLCQIICAQSDSIVRLREVLVSDMQLRQFSNMQSVQKIDDSIIENNRPSLTLLLNYNSVIYFKENGLGMVSSPSFRGTTAQQTAVVWNGININSQFNGQTDFNTITAKDFNSIAIRAGGGSVIYGSSAIGGSIHLNNDLEFKNQFKNAFESSYGSFNTVGIHYNVAASSEKFSVQVGISRNSSDNDYGYIGSDLKNTNGQFYNTSFTGNFGYKINASNFLKFYSQLFDGEQHFSLLTPTDTKTKYRDFNMRNMLEWAGFYGPFESRLKVAFLSEEYQYFEGLDADYLGRGKAESVITKYDLAYAPTAKIKLAAIADYTQTNGWGTDVAHHKRDIGSAALLMKHEIFDKFQYEIGVRKEMTANYDSPFLFSVGMKSKFGKHYTFKWSGSHNFRIPTFNDLYWLDGGNPNLKPESSYQTEIGNEFAFKNLKFSITGYHMEISDMIQWLPGTSASWFPQNVDKVKTYGAEALLNWQKSIGKHQFAFNGTYAYTVSKNEETGYQLIYVPYHKATGSLAYAWKKLTVDYQVLFNGEVFTRSDNNSRYNIDPYTVSNIGIGYDFGKTNTYKLGFKVLNLFDENYEVMDRRPFPGRNFNIYLNLNF
ncbi:MAG TPA: TonB-dependent receptor [Flavobacterium sp.]|nr:TonB-dependent receptor [Flavobacterium sp.]